MAYEISGSITAGSQRTVTVAGATTSSKTSGGRFNPLGTKLAVPSQATGINDVVGVDIFVSSSGAGWHIDDDFEISFSSAYQVEWLDESTLAVMTDYGLYTFASSSSGWDGGTRRTNSFKTAFLYSPGQDYVAVYDPATSGGGTDDVDVFRVQAGSYSFGHRCTSTTGPYVGGVAWVSDKEIAIGQPSSNGFGGTSQTGRISIWTTTNDWDTGFETELIFGDQANENIGAALYYHTASDELLVGTGVPDSNFGDAQTDNLWYVYKSSSSDNYLPASRTNRTILTKVGSSDRRVPAGWTIQKAPGLDAFAIGMAGIEGSGGSQGSQADVLIWESGSEGWKAAVVDDNSWIAGMADGQTAMVGLSKEGYIAANDGVNAPNDGTSSTFKIHRFNMSGDITGPSVSSIALESADSQNSLLNIGDVVAARVTFDEATVVTTTGGTPTIALNIGGVSRNASYASGTGNAEIVFTYTITSGETADTDGISIDANSISLNGGTMKDAAGNNATLTHSAVAANSSFKVDVARPTISSLSVSADNTTVTVTFSEDVYASSAGSGDLVAADFIVGLSGGNAGSISLNSTPSGIAKTAQNIWVLTLNGTDLDTNALGTETLSVDAAHNAAIFDLAGNAHTANPSTTTLNDTSTLSDTVSTAVNASAGGTVSAGNTNASPRVSVTIPADSLSANTTIGVDTSDGSSPATLGIASDGGESISPVVRLTPHGTQFSSAVTVTFRLTGTAAGTCPTNAQLFKRNSPTGNWYPVPTNLYSCTDGVISLSTTSFSDYIVIGGQIVARTKLNNVQLARLENVNKVLPEAINISGSSNDGLDAANISDLDLFLISDVSDGLTRPVSGSQLKTYFAGAGINVTGSNADDLFRIVFVDPTLNNQVGLAVDNDAAQGDADGLRYRPSTNTLVVGGPISGSSTLSVGGAAELEGTLNVEGAASLDSTLSVAGLATMQNISGSGTLIIGGATELEGTVNIEGAASLDSTLSVAGLATMQNISGSGTLSVGGATELEGTVNIEGAASLDSTLSVAGLATMQNISGSGTLSIGGTTELEGALNVEGAATFDSTISGSSNISAAGTLHIQGNSELEGTLNVEGAATFDAAISGSSTLSAAGALHVGGNGEIEGTLNVEGAASFDGAISGSGNLSAAGALHIGGNGEIEGTLNVEDAVTLDETLVVNATSKASATDNSLLVEGTSQVKLTANEYFRVTTNSNQEIFKASEGGDIEFGGGSSTGIFLYDASTNDIKLKNPSNTGETAILLNDGFNGGIISGSGDITMKGAGKFGGKVAVSGAISGSSTLSIGGATQLEGTLNVEGAASFDAAATFDSNVTVAGNLVVNGTTTQIDTTNLLVEDAIIVLADGNGAATVDQGLVFTRGGVTNQMFLWDESADQFALVATAEDGTTSGSVTISSYSAFQVGDITGSDATLSGDITVAGNVAGGTFSGDGSGLSGVGASVDVSSGASAALQIPFVSGSDAAATFFVDTNAITFNPSSNQLAVAGPISGSGVLTMKGAGMFGGKVAVSGAISGSSTLSVGGASQLEGTLNVEGAVDFDSTLNVDGTATLATVDINGGNIDGTIIGATTKAAGSFTSISGSTTLSIGGATELEGTLNVEGAASFDAAISGSTTLSIGGATELEGTLNVEGAADFDSTLNVDGTATLATVDINGGNIDGTIIGGTTKAAGSFTSISGSTTLSIGGAAELEGTLNVEGAVDLDSTLNVDGAVTLGSVAALSVDLSDETHHILVQDSDDGIVKKTTFAAVLTSSAGNGLQTAAGKLKIETVDLVATQYQRMGVLSDDYVTASLVSGDTPLSGSLQVFLNGMLLVGSSSAQAYAISASLPAGAGVIAEVFDYYYFTDSPGRRVEFVDAIDEDDVIQIKYIKQ